MRDTHENARPFRLLLFTGHIRSPVGEAGLGCHSVERSGLFQHETAEWIDHVENRTEDSCVRWHSVLSIVEELVEQRQAFIGECFAKAGSQETKGVRANKERQQAQDLFRIQHHHVNAERDVHESSFHLSCSELVPLAVRSSGREVGLLTY